MEEYYNTYITGRIMVIEILHDRFDLFRTPEVSHQIEHHVRSADYPDLVFDISRISYIDSSGFGFLVSLRNIVAKRGRASALVCSNDEILHVINVMNIQRIFSVHATVKDALDGFKRA